MLNHFIEQLFQIAVRDADIFVCGAVVDQQFAVDDDVSAGEYHSFVAVAACQLIPFLRFKDRLFRSGDDGVRLLQVQQERSQPVIVIGAQAVVDDQPAFVRFDWRCVCPDFLCLPVTDGKGKFSGIAESQRIVGIGKPDAGNLRAENRAVKIIKTVMNLFRKQDDVMILPVP